MSKNSRSLLQEEYQAQRDEQEKYGIYFDDNYNYMQHLKERHDNANISQDNVDFIYIGSNKVNLALKFKQYYYYNEISN